MTSSKHSGFSPLTTKFVGLVALVLASLGASGVASAHGATEKHGIIEARGPSVKVVAQGPIVFHAYSAFGGGSLYAVRAVTGTDRDCQDAAGAATPIQADRIAMFTVGDNQVACLATTTNASFELLWHAVREPIAAPVVYAKAGR